MSCSDADRHATGNNGAKEQIGHHVMLYGMMKEICRNAKMKRKKSEDEHDIDTKLTEDGALTTVSVYGNLNVGWHAQKLVTELGMLSWICLHS